MFQLRMKSESKNRPFTGFKITTTESIYDLRNNGHNIFYLCMHVHCMRMCGIADFAMTTCICKTNMRFAIQGERNSLQVL